MTSLHYFANEQAAVEEALRRAVSIRLLTAWLYWRRGKKLPGQAGAEYQAMRPALLALIEPQLLAYRQQVIAEFNSLLVRFADPDRRRTDASNYKGPRRRATDQKDAVAS